MSGPTRPSVLVARVAVGLVATVIMGCSDPRPPPADATASETTTTATTSVVTSDESEGDSTTHGAPPDVAHRWPGGSLCTPDIQEGLRLDVLIVVDNSITMADDQANVAANFSRIGDALIRLTDRGGVPVYPHANLMVTTTDVGHPLCDPSRRGARAGAPVYTSCNARIASFTTGGDDPIDVSEACSSVCPVDVLPSAPFIHFDYAGSNVPDHDIAAALSCIGPQGIDGCEYEAPLEAMMLALDPTACWNDPDGPGCADDPEWADLEAPFLRECATLVVILITDEADCSVESDRSFAAFTSDDQYWETHPDTGLPTVSSAVCHNAGVLCEGPDAQGTYDGCASIDTGVLRPTQHYVDALREYGEHNDKKVVMLAALGVPPVTAYDRDAPYIPSAGGVLALEPRTWRDADLTAAEVESGVTVQHKVWELGPVAPGCATEHGGAIFSTRVREVCEGLGQPDDPRTDDVEETQVRCCIESICDDDFSTAIGCIAETIPNVIPK